MEQYAFLYDARCSLKHRGLLRRCSGAIQSGAATVTSCSGAQRRPNIEHRPSGRTAGILDLIASKTISGKIAKDVFDIVWTEGGDPADIVEKRGLKQVTDLGAIEKAVDEVLAANPDKVEQVKAKPTMLGWFVGQVMKATGGKANPAAVNEVLKQKLGI